MLENTAATPPAKVAWAGHVLRVRATEHHTAEWPDFDLTMDCTLPERCNGWTECPEDHDGYDPHDEDSPACDQFEDVEIHGVFHTWEYSYGWTVPFDGCVVKANSNWAESGWEIGRTHGPGDYRVEDEWEDGWCVILHVIDRIEPVADTTEVSHA